MKSSSGVFGSHLTSNVTRRLKRLIVAFVVPLKLRRKTYCFLYSSISKPATEASIFCPGTAVISELTTRNRVSESLI